MGGGRRRKKRTQNSNQEDAAKVPRTFVMQNGKIGSNGTRLMKDIRLVMEPYTARRLKVNSRNSLKDFVHVAGPLGVTHFLIISKTDNGTYLKVIRLPRGPTITFGIDSYTHVRDIISYLRRPKTEVAQFKTPPLLVMNGFSTDIISQKLIVTMFQNIFSAIDVHKVRLANIKRCVLLNFNPESKTIEFRHYNIRVVPVGISKRVKKLLGQKIPNMNKLEDISEYITRDAYGSESEADDNGPESHVILPHTVPGKGNTKSQQSAIKLGELGPRMTMNLIKIQDGICAGEVLYHQYVTKTKDELKQIKLKIEQKRKLKVQRRKQQDENIKRKEMEKEVHRKRSLSGMTANKTITESKETKKSKKSMKTADLHKTTLKGNLVKRKLTQKFKSLPKKRRRTS